MDGTADILEMRLQTLKDTLPSVSKLNLKILEDRLLRLLIAIKEAPRKNYEELVFLSDMLDAATRSWEVVLHSENSVWSETAVAQVTRRVMRDWGTLEMAVRFSDDLSIVPLPAEFIEDAKANVLKKLLSERSIQDLTEEDIRQYISQISVQGYQFATFCDVPSFSSSDGFRIYLDTVVLQAEPESPLLENEIQVALPLWLTAVRQQKAELVLSKDAEKPEAPQPTISDSIPLPPFESGVGSAWSANEDKVDNLQSGPPPTCIAIPPIEAM